MARRRRAGLLGPTGRRRAPLRPLLLLLLPPPLLLLTSRILWSL
jgi:hypothetical protein